MPSKEFGNKSGSIIEINGILKNFEKLDQDKKIDILGELVKSIKINARNAVPVSVFDNKKLSIFEALSKYMKENLEMRFVEIASMLKRSDKTIWVTYHNSLRKMPKKFEGLDCDILVPLNHFSNKNLTMFESLAIYLKDYGLTNHKIAVMLNRDDRTIWSTLHRATKKRKENAKE